MKKELLKNLTVSEPVSNNMALANLNTQCIGGDIPGFYTSFSRELLAFDKEGHVSVVIPFRGVCVQVGDVFTLVHLECAMGKTFNITADAISKRSELDIWNTVRGFEIAYGRAFKLLKQKILGNGKKKKIHHLYKG